MSSRVWNSDRMNRIAMMTYGDGTIVEDPPAPKFLATVTALRQFDSGQITILFVL